MMTATGKRNFYSIQGNTECAHHRGLKIEDQVGFACPPISDMAAAAVLYG
jgi:hypothetical protein